MSFISLVPVIFALIIFTLDISLGQEAYDGHYDLRARDAGYLCQIMQEYLVTGKQPNLNKTSAQGLSREFFTRPDRKCWKFAWIPCDKGTYKKTDQRPCGWYQMQNAGEEECG